MTTDVHRLSDPETIVDPDWMARDYIHAFVLSQTGKSIALARLSTPIVLTLAEAIAKSLQPKPEPKFVRHHDEEQIE